MDNKTKKIIAIIIVIISIGLITTALFMGEKKYSVTFKNLESTTVVEVTKDGRLVKPADPIRSGYKFIGWYYNGELFDFSQKITSDLKLEAKWEKNDEDPDGTKHKIIFKNEDGTEISSVDIDENGNVTRPDDPVKDGYNFVGWYNGEELFDFSTPITSEINLVAKFEKIPDNVKTYKVTFNTDGGNKIAAKTVEENKPVTKPADPTKTGYEFISWQLDGQDYDFSTNVTKDITLKATWKALAKYTIKFNTDGGSTIKDVIVYEGGKLSKPANPTKTGYAFVSWQLDGKDYNFNAVVTKNMTLNATWRALAKYTVKFDTDGGNTINDATVYEGGKVTKPSNPTKTGYVFVSWQLDGKDYNFNTTVTKNITLKATYRQAKSYTVTFDSNGGSSVNNQTISEGGKATKPSNPTKDGSTFVRWELNGKEYNFSSTVSANITLVAKWSQKNYTFDYKVVQMGSPEVAITVYEDGKALSSFFEIRRVSDDKVICGSSGITNGTNINNLNSVYVVLTSGGSKVLANKK